jgi:hypothetical protein
MFIFIALNLGLFWDSILEGWVFQIVCLLLIVALTGIEAGLNLRVFRELFRIRYFNSEIAKSIMNEPA